MSNYVLYARKSTESDDRQILSLDSQIRELKSVAARQGVEVKDVLTESHSAKAPGRPVFGELMRRVRRGNVQGILCWKMDRLARNHLDTGQVLQALADGLLDRVITIDRTYTKDGNDRFIGSFELGIATKFIDDLRQNVKRGLRAKLEQGWISYRAPVGYLNDVVNKTVVTDPDRFPLVRRMWDLVLTGTMRPEQIARIANDDWGLRTHKRRRMGGKPLSLSVVYRIFANPFYAGLIPASDGRYLPGRHEPMISKAEFDRVQEILGRPGRPRPQKHEFPLTGLFRCGTCRAAITAEEHVKPSGRRYVYYRCTHRKPGTDCHEPALPAAELEAQIARQLERLTMPDAIHQMLVERARRTMQVEAAQRANVRTTLEQAVLSVKREEEALLSLRLRELLTDDLYVQKRQEILDRRVSLEDRLRRADENVNATEVKLQATLAFAQSAKKTFVTGTMVQKRMILEAVGLNSEIRSKKVLISAKKPFSMLVDAHANSSWQGIVEDIRTWLLNTTEYFNVPDLSMTQHDLSLPSEATLHLGG